MRTQINIRSLASLLVVFCLLSAPISAFAKKGEKNFKRGMQYESAQQWEKAAQEFTLAVAADPANLEYQLHYRRAVFNASQSFMQQGRALAEQHDYVGAYNAFRQAYGYDPVNQLALSEMERMLRLQGEKDGTIVPGSSGASHDNDARLRSASMTDEAGSGSAQSNGTGGTPAAPSTQRAGATDAPLPPPRTEQLRVINFSGDLKNFIRKLAEDLNLNVVFDRQSFSQSRNVDVNLRDVTAAQALDYIFLQENLFFQKLSRRTILVAEQTRRAQYQQLVLRTFYLSNMDPDIAASLVTRAIPASAGRPQTIVVPDKLTNSITVRDTSENVRLIGDLLRSVDKDRAEVVMDVNIYEVSRTDLIQFGNQIGSSTDTISLGGTSGLLSTLGSRQVVTQVLNRAPTALGGAILIPAANFLATQGRNRSKLIASTQIHAFSGEKSTARIGQRVPVQTAQTFPFGGINNTGTTTGNVNTGIGFGGGFPVFNYEPTGLTLNFKPQVFPNLDVQVEMEIESKEVFNPGATPTFTERKITGTARIQNNRTMMIASIAQDRQSSGRQGLPLVGLIPVLGRLFTAPRRDDAQTDIVIAVTPRVLRAPAVTPRDEELRPSGTLQTPTNGSLEAMVRETDREDQLAAARRIPNNIVVQLPDAEAPAYVPAPKALATSGAATQTGTGNPSANASATATTASVTTTPRDTSTTVRPTPINASANTSARVNETSAVRTVDLAAAIKALLPDMEPPAYAPAPKALMTSGANAAEANTNVVAASSSKNVTANLQPMSGVVSSRAAASVHADVPTGSLKTTSARVDLPRPFDAGDALTSLRTQPTVAPMDDSAPVQYSAPVTTAPSSAPAVETSLRETIGSTASKSACELRLVPEQQEMRVGEKRRLALVLKTDAPLGLAVITLRFDPRRISVRGISHGNLFAGTQSSAPPIITQSIDTKGVLLVSIAPPAGTAQITGAGVLLFVDIEGIASGESAISFDKDNVHLVASDGRSIFLQLVQSRVTVK